MKSTFTMTFVNDGIYVFYACKFVSVLDFLYILLHSPHSFARVCEQSLWRAMFLTFRA